MARALRIEIPGRRHRVYDAHTNLAQAYNGYLGSGQARLPGTNFNNVVVADFSYVSGPFGSYYHASTNLSDQGSRNARDAGLYHHTTRLDSGKELDSTVDISFHYPATESYLACDGFSASAQGANGWYYKYSSSLQGHPDQAMPSYNPTYSAWAYGAGDAWCLVSTNWLHPGTSHDSALAYLLPFTGTVRIDSAAYDGNNCDQDAVRVRILKNTSTLIDWTHVAEGTTAANPVALNVAAPLTVAAGDYLYFQVNKNTNNACDKVFWNPRVTYLDAARVADANGDGVEDVSEDTNGNGSVDSGESDWQDASDEGFGVWIARPARPGPLP